MDEKQCSKCSEWKPEDAFPANSLGKGGRHSQCQSCRKKALAQLRAGYRVDAEEGVVDDGRICVRCKVWKAAALFSRSRAQRGGLNGSCKPCQADEQSYRLYGLPHGGFDLMLKQQGGRCGICDSDEARSKGRFHVDHEHVSEFGRLGPLAKRIYIRGLLCGRCNHWLGVIEAAVGLEALRSGGYWAGRALAYLAAYEARLAA